MKMTSFAGGVASPAQTQSRPWDARIARLLVAPLVDTAVSPNHLTTVRLTAGLAGACAFAAGGYAWSNAGALLLVLSNFLDHTDGELARMSGKTSRFGHIYDLASDALIHVLIFAAIGWGLHNDPAVRWDDAALARWAPLLGVLAGGAVSLIFWLRMRIEERLGKSATRQPALGGFEAEDVLYLMPLVTLAGALQPFLLAAAIGAPLYALWVISDYRRMPHEVATQQP